MSLSAASAGRPPRDLVRSSGRTLYAVIVPLSLAVYTALAWTAYLSPQAGLTVGFYAVVLAVAGLVVHGLTLGHLRGSGVKVSTRRLPLLHRMVTEYAAKLGTQAPDVYVVQAGGLLNAFATRFSRRVRRRSRAGPSLAGSSRVPVAHLAGANPPLPGQRILASLRVHL